MRNISAIIRENLWYFHIFFSSNIEWVNWMFMNSIIMHIGFYILKYILQWIYAQ